MGNDIHMDDEPSGGNGIRMTYFVKENILYMAYAYE